MRMDERIAGLTKQVFDTHARTHAGTARMRIRMQVERSQGELASLGEGGIRRATSNVSDVGGRLEELGEACGLVAIDNSCNSCRK